MKQVLAALCIIAIVINVYYGVLYQTAEDLWDDKKNGDTSSDIPANFTVTVPAGKDLGAVVARADPSGRMAAAVDRYTSFSSGTAGLTTLAVDP